MDPITIGLWTTGGMLALVFLGMRVAFAAGLAGFVGLVWLRWNGFDYAPERLWKSVEISVKVAGQVPHCLPVSLYRNKSTKSKDATARKSFVPDRASPN